ncbi:hypothetical protein [Rhizobium freirei]|uniref:hypothetical protein n=1 Tax=Rhizobium freirei TaxID=1353277 RepID=UPI001F0A8FC3|nr:hypothetical protein [Rhizobium freirei]
MAIGGAACRANNIVFQHLVEERVSRIPAGDTVLESDVGKSPPRQTGAIRIGYTKMTGKGCVAQEPPLLRRKKSSAPRVSLVSRYETPR